MERLLQYVWKHRLYEESDFTTTEGHLVCVIDPGIHNTDAGPDFLNAKVRIGNTVWAGNIEIHKRATEWYAHRHDIDKAYDSVILHVVEHDDGEVRRIDNEIIPQVVMRVPKKIKANIDWLLARDTSVACAGRIPEISSLHLSDWMSALVTERLERKTEDIFMRLKQYSTDWNEMFYITLMRNFGFGVNSDAFEWLAKTLPYKYIMKHRDKIQQIEAMLFGQAGLLDTNEADHEDPYFLLLKREYGFLKNKYDLSPVEGFLFKKLRTRPVNFPHIRLAQVATVFANNDLLFSKILETEELDKIRAFFDISPSEYWNTHFHFRHSSVSKKKHIGKNAANIIIVNTVIPVLFAYGKQKKMPEFCERALSFLEKLPPENNNVTTLFKNAGIIVKSAADTQALIQLKREYCEKKKCLYCRIGLRVIDN